MVKCVTPKCRSGYKPSKEEFEMIRKGQIPPCKRHVFSLPKNPELRWKWIRSVSRKDKNWNPNKFGVCEVHFKPEDFLTDLAPKTKTKRKRARLKPDAVPSVFPDDPPSARPKVIKERVREASRVTASARRCYEEKLLEQQTERFVEADRINDVDDLHTKLSNEVLPSGYRLVMMQLRNGEKVLSIRREEMDEVTFLPVIISNITIRADLTFFMHTNGVEVHDSKVGDIIAKPGQFTTVGEVVNVLARVKEAVPDRLDHLEAAAKLLDTLLGQTIDEGMRLVATFTAEQLRVVRKPAARRKYSSFVLGNAFIWERTSPNLYNLMHKSGLLCLPHPRTLRRLTSALQVSSGLEGATMTYLRMRMTTLDPRDRLVNLAMDEVYTEQAVELCDRTINDESTGKVTTSLFCTHINSVVSKYEDMISMLPVTHITRNEIGEIFHKILKGLTELGYNVVSVTTDDHPLYQSWHNTLGPNDHHPLYFLNPYSEEEKRVYPLYDTGHIYKNLYYGLLRRKTLTVPPFPGSEDPRQLKVNFDHLSKLHKLECGKPERLAYQLNSKVLNPSALECINVRRAAAATHETSCKALRHFAVHRPDCSEFQDTAEFLELIRRWFNACNIKSELKASRLNDSDQVALRSKCPESEKILEFILTFGNFMCSWSESTVTESEKMPNDTCMAAYHTSRGLVSLTHYLLEKHSDILSYVLLGKIQSDRIEAHFGHLRKQAGGSYWAIVRQFMKSDVIFRTKSLIWWTGYCVNAVATAMVSSRQQCGMKSMEVVQQLVEVVSRAELEELDDSTEAALKHIAGYLAQSATKDNICNACVDMLVDRYAEPLEVKLEESDAVDEVYKSFRELLDRGKLLVPTHTAIDITLYVSYVWRALVKNEESRCKLLGCDFPKNVFIETALALASYDSQFTGASCLDGHSLDKLLSKMAGTLFNLFADNTVYDVNSDIHATQEPSISTSDER